MTIVGLAWHGWLFRNTYFMGPVKLKASGSPKLPILQVLNNPINIFKINSKIIVYGVFSSNIYECQKYHQHQFNTIIIDWKIPQLLEKMVLTIQLNCLASLAKWLTVRWRTKWLWVQVPLESLKFQTLCLFRARRSLTFRQLQSLDLNAVKNTVTF